MIETERLLLRDWQPSDAAPFAALNADPEVTRYLRGPMSRYASDELVARIRAHWHAHAFGLYAVEIKSSGVFAGFVGLAVPSFLPDVLPAVEVGWRLAREHWGQGYATEGAGRASTTASAISACARSSRSSIRATPRRSASPSGWTWCAVAIGSIHRLASASRLREKCGRCGIVAGQPLDAETAAMKVSPDAVPRPQRAKPPGCEARHRNSATDLRVRR